MDQKDQPLDALFFTFDFTKNQLIVKRTGQIQDIVLCPDVADESRCLPPIETDDGVPSATTVTAPTTKGSILKGMANQVKKLLGGDPNAPQPVEYVDYVPLNYTNRQYATKFGIRFTDKQRGLYNFIYHNCFNYRAHGYSDKVAVDFTVDIVEKNIESYLSAGDIAKPQLYLYVSFMFLIAAFVWAYTLIKSERQFVYKTHRLMTVLVFIKALSLFFHGINYYFVAVEGRQQEIWAFVYYITHLLKGALLFGTLIFIGTGYTFFKNFLSDRDRRLFMVVLPLQVIDNIAMVIIEESEFGEQRYQFWFEIFVFLDIICCVAVLLPVIWSVKHLEEGAKSDGKAAFNLEKLKLFRHFYTIVVAYIYLTRIIKLFVEMVIPFNYSWMCEAVVELSTLFFFVLAGYKFRPEKRNPYFKLSQDSDDEEDGVALTTNGLFENVSRVNRPGHTVVDLTEIPGAIGGENLRRTGAADVEKQQLPKSVQL
uniref:Protein GPR107 n=1 Tax=Steinernema glaseri TaxID=37863 RepID=A0A1I8ART0_9BILA